MLATVRAPAHARRELFDPTRHAAATSSTGHVDRFTTDIVRDTAPSPGVTVMVSCCAPGSPLDGHDDVQPIGLVLPSQYLIAVIWAKYWVGPTGVPEPITVMPFSCVGSADAAVAVGRRSAATLVRERLQVVAERHEQRVGVGRAAALVIEAEVVTHRQHEGDDRQRQNGQGAECLDEGFAARDLTSPCTACTTCTGRSRARPLRGPSSEHLVPAHPPMGLSTGGSAPMSRFAPYALGPTTYSDVLPLENLHPISGVVTVGVDELHPSP